MIVINNGPEWFFGLDTIFEVVCGLIAMLASLFSYRVYKFTHSKKYYSLFGAFLLIASAFGLRATGALLMHMGFYERIISVLDLFDVIFLGQMALLLLAYTIILLRSLEITSKRLVAFIMSLMVMFIVFSYQYYLKFHIIVFLLLFFLAVNFYLNYRKQKSVNSALVFAGFYLLMMAQPFFIFTVHLNQKFYIIGQSLQVLGFLAIFFMLIRVTRSK